VFCKPVMLGYGVAQLVGALRYKLEGRGFDSRWAGSTMALGLTQPLTEMSTMNNSWGVKAAVRRADNLTTFMC
jgi:hypothetical protein